jgi:hypothetical protein
LNGALQSFCDRVCIPEVVLVSLQERFGIGWWHLFDLMTERNQLARDVVRPHAGFDAGQARRQVRKTCGNPTRETFSRRTIAPFSSRPIICSVFLPVSIPMVRATEVVALLGMAYSSSCSSMPPTDSAFRWGREHGRSIPFETVDWATSKPSIRSSLWIRDAPQFGFSLLIRRITQALIDLGAPLPYSEISSARML